MPDSGRMCSVGFNIGNKGYYGTGTIDPYGNGFNDLWEYDPNSNAGIHELHNQIKTTLSPNPFSDKTTITIAGNPANASLNIYDIQGQKVRSIAVGNKQIITVERAGLPAGMYFYELVGVESTNPTQHTILATGKMVVE